MTAVCDVDERLFPKAIREVEELGGNKPDTYVDFRDLLDKKEIDAVGIATPDHWHALQTIWACQAGKDVYVEKPISYTIDEGRKMVQAARKYNRVVQVGTQSRSHREAMEAVKVVREGTLGDVYLGRGIVYGHRSSIGHVEDSPTPEGVHWDMFLGPAPYRPFNENRFHYNWHWFWDTSTTEFGNNGVHAMDIIRWAMNKRVHPVKIQCTGGLYGREDSDQEIPNLQVATFEYEDGTILETEVRSLFTNPEFGEKGGSFIYGTEGWLYRGSGGFKTFLGSDDEPGPSGSGEELTTVTTDKKTSEVLKGIEPHYVNFTDCVRSRRWQDLNADILEGHLSTTMMHLGNIAYRTGRTLHFDPYSERFIDDDQANAYLTRNYRYPYVLPEKI